MRIKTIALAILLPLFTMAETISFTYLGTNNDDLGPYHGLTMPATVTIADIPEAAAFSPFRITKSTFFSIIILGNFSLTAFTPAGPTTSPRIRIFILN